MRYQDFHVGGWGKKNARIKIAQAHVLANYINILMFLFFLY